MVPDSNPSATPVLITEEQEAQFLARDYPTHMGVDPADPHGEQIAVYHVPDVQYRVILGQNVERLGREANRLRRKQRRQAVRRGRR